MDSSSSDRTELSDTTSRMNDMLGALQYRDFRYYWFSALSFVLGWQILRMVLNWVGYDLTNSAIYLGALGGAMAVGTISVSLIGGVIAYFALRRDDREKAKKCLYLGLILLVVGVLLELFVASSLPPEYGGANF